MSILVKSSIVAFGKHNGVSAFRSFAVRIRKYEAMYGANGR